MTLKSQVIISRDFIGTIEKLKSLKTTERFIDIISENGFLVDEVKEVFDKASIATEENLVIIMAAKSFSDIVQNRLLKLLEEPPKNKIFIILAPQKAMILDTIKSRLPMTIMQEQIDEIELGFDVANLSLQNLFDFSKLHKNTKPVELAPILDKIILEALRSKNFNTDYKTLELFGKAIKSLHFGGQPNFILSMILLKLLATKHNKNPNLNSRISSETIQNRR